MTAATETAKQARSRPRRLLRSPFFWAALAGLIIIPAIRPLLRHVPDPPPVLGQLPSFSLVDQRGEAFGSEQLRGQVYVANFVFTSCKTICPKLSRAMKRLQDRYSKNKVPVQLVSFSVDPENDDPPTLRRYARKYGADPARWTFLTGPLSRVRGVVVGSFRVSMGDRIEVGAGLVDISHAGVFALVDRVGGVRGLYRPDDEGLDEIYHRSMHVLKAGR